MHNTAGIGRRKGQTHVDPDLRGIGLVPATPMGDSIPDEFQPKKQEQALQDHEGEEISNLFANESDDEDDDNAGTTIESVTIGDANFRLRLPPDVGTLFAHRVWSGSKLLARYLDSNSDLLVRGKRTIEFGAGTGLPSLVALSKSSLLSVITDYPDDDILNSIRETVGWNWKPCLRPVDRVAVVGHEWGTPTKEIEDVVSRLRSSDSEVSSNAFDLAILSECLWMHRCHGALAASIDRLLNTESGVAVVTYAHHIPGKEEEDDAFFDICESQYGLKVETKVAEELEYMWDREKTIVVYLVVMRRSCAKGT